MERSFEKLSFSFVIILLLAFNVHAGGGIVGKVTILKGQVFIKRGSAKIPVKKDDTVLESDIIESEAGTARITMIDSNLVDVYPRSRLEIAKYVYKPNQDQKDVELKVDFGKIKSTVNQKYDGAKNKFQVKTPSAVAGVRGTVFTAEYDAVKKISRVVTIEGLVAVTKMLDRGERQSPPVFVRPDQVVRVDVEQSSAEQPRDLKPEEKETRQKEDKDLGYQYDTKKEAPAASEQKPATAPPSAAGRPTGERPTPSIAVAEPKREIKEIVNREAPTKEVREVKEIANQEAPVKEIREQIKEVSAAEPAKEQVKEAKERLRERLKETREEKREKQEAKNEIVLKEPVKIKENITAVSNNLNERQQQQQQDQERRQKESEEEQAKKQKQLEDEQAKKQKQLEGEQAKKQKQLEDEQARRQKQLEEEQAKKQKQLEDEQAKKQKQLEDEQARKQKQLEEEQQKRQREIEEAQKKAEAARRAQEIANRLKDTIGLPAGTSPGTNLPGTTITPKQ